MTVTALPAGPFALLAEVADVDAAQSLYAAMVSWRKTDLTELVELVPAARTVLAVASPDDAGRQCLSRLATRLAEWTPVAGTSAVAAGPVTVLPIRYDGPDLAAVATEVGLTVDELARQHARAGYRVAFCGFAPGFAYLTGLPAQLHVPRLDEPRTRVPAGAVGLAGEFCGVYPRESPGGWRLIGSTDAPLWDAGREPAALLAPGTTVRFRPC
jgi:KipI family sensor histidine kinase inhibitor